MLQLVSIHLRSPVDAWVKRQMCKSASTTVTMPVAQSLSKDCTSCCGMRDVRCGSSQTNSERVEEADDGVDVALQEEALEGIEDVLVLVLEMRDRMKLRWRKTRRRRRRRQLVANPRHTGKRSERRGA
nr:unnamed protein product [Digitaria exilis]